MACRNDASISSVQSGDLLRVTGTVVQPDDPTAPARLTVDALEVLEVLEAALLPAIGDCGQRNLRSAVR
ncbi:hypothetical protein ACWC0A_31815 [Streptomyces scopuliridis]